MVKKARQMMIILIMRVWGMLKIQEYTERALHVSGEKVAIVTGHYLSPNRRLIPYLSFPSAWAVAMWSVIPKTVWFCDT